jgi:hypothetical protein
MLVRMLAVEISVLSAVLGVIVFRYFVARWSDTVFDSRTEGLRRFSVRRHIMYVQYVK